MIGVLLWSFVIEQITGGLLYSAQPYPPYSRDGTGRDAAWWRRDGRCQLSTGRARMEQLVGVAARLRQFCWAGLRLLARARRSFGRM
jgi:hypothetical protein